MLHVFDMDGTLLPGTSATKEMAKVLGHAPDIDALERAFATGRIDTRQFARAIYRLWGPMDPGLVRVAFDASPKMRRIREVVADIGARGYRSAVITMSPLCFADHFTALGFDEVHGSVFPRSPKAEIDTEAILRPCDKPLLTHAMCVRHGIGPDRVVAYGDSLSDRYLFEVATVSVAVNGDAHVRDLATVDYTGRDLWEAYELALSRSAPPKPVMSRPAAAGAAASRSLQGGPVPSRSAAAPA